MLEKANASGNVEDRDQDLSHAERRQTSSGSSAINQSEATELT
jgi:hypothetical protein